MDVYVHEYILTTVTLSLKEDTVHVGFIHLDKTETSDL